MKDARNIQRSLAARHRQAFKHAADLAALLDEKTPATFSDVDMVNARELANEISQCIHELNAYRNVVRG